MGFKAERSLLKQVEFSFPLAQPKQGLLKRVFGYPKVFNEEGLRRIHGTPLLNISPSQDVELVIKKVDYSYRQLGLKPLSRRAKRAVRKAHTYNSLLHNNK